MAIPLPHTDSSWIVTYVVSKIACNYFWFKYSKLEILACSFLAFVSVPTNTAFSAKIFQRRIWTIHV